MSDYAFDSEIQERKRPKGLIAFLSCLVVILLVSTLGLGYMLANSSAAQYAKAITSDYEALKEEHQKLTEAYGLLEKKCADHQQVAQFWSRENVIVAQYGSTYHSYGCEIIAGGQRYTIYNVEDAVNHGYAPCDVCDPIKPYGVEGGRFIPITPW